MKSIIEICKKHKLIVTVVGIALILMIVIGVSAGSQKSSAKSTVNNSSINGETGSAGNENSAESPNEEKKEKQDDSIYEDRNVSSGVPVSGYPADIQSKGDSSARTTQRITDIGLPYPIPDTNLVIRSLTSFDGSFVEDGTDEEVTNVAGIVIENTGADDVEYVEINLDADGETYRFSGSGLKGNSSILILEADKKPSISADNITGASATVSSPDNFSLLDNMIQIEETDEQRIVIKNLSDQELAAVKVFYKYYQTDGNIFLGGITYVTTAYDVEPGDSVELYPEHFSAADSVITMIRTYNSDELGE